MPSSELHGPVLDWYAEHARDLPWREQSASAWGVLVSEVMLQQTPVNRVLPVYEQWLERWPTAPDLAAASRGDAVRAWSRLGYPRRALRLHEAAVAIVDRHDGQVPSSYDDLLALPGVGSYTAAAVASFSFGQRHAVLDTNVRRVLARTIEGHEAPGPNVTGSEREVAERLLPDDDAVAARWAVAVMELGAMVCTSRAPRCADCPVRTACQWHRAGRPAYEGPRRRSQRFEGTDRQVRGLIIALLRESAGPVGSEVIAILWPERAQLERALASLCSDGLIERSAQGYTLPGGQDCAERTSGGQASGG